MLGGDNSRRVRSLTQQAASNPTIRVGQTRSGTSLGSQPKLHVILAIAFTDSLDAFGGVTVRFLQLLGCEISPFSGKFADFGRGNEQNLIFRFFRKPQMCLLRKTRGHEFFIFCHRWNVHCLYFIFSFRHRTHQVGFSVNLHIFRPRFGFENRQQCTKGTV